MKKKPRRLADPFVVAPPCGARIRTRLHPGVSEATKLARIGDFLGGLARADLSARLRLGDVAGKDDLRTQRKQTLTAATSSRWAGSITRAANDQYALGLRALSAERDTLNAATAMLAKRCAVPVGACDIATRIKGYRDEGERFAKTRRLAALQTRLRAGQLRISAARPRMVIGGNRLWRNKNSLNQAGLTEAQWRDQWTAVRAWMCADGESGKRFGNETIRVTDEGQVTIKIPAALVAELGIGTHLKLGVPAVFSYRNTEWADRVSANQAVRYDITFDPARNRWYLDASWKTPASQQLPTVAQLGSQRHLGVDLNADHLAACVIDAAGNPVGEPYTIPLELAGLPALTRDARLREAISQLIAIAHTKNCGAITIENLGFADARATGRETMGRGRRGKSFRRVVASIPTAQFRDRLAAMCWHQGLYVIAVDAAYSSRWGAQHWREPLQTQTSPTTVTRHHAAAAALGRRSHRQSIRRRKAGPRTRQRTSPGLPATRPNNEPVTADDGNVLPHPPRQQRRTGPAGNAHRQLSTPFGEQTEPDSLLLTD